MQHIEKKLQTPRGEQGVKKRCKFHPISPQIKPFFHPFAKKKNTSFYLFTLPCYILFLSMRFIRNGIKLDENGAVIRDLCCKQPQLLFFLKNGVKKV